MQLPLQLQGQAIRKSYCLVLQAHAAHEAGYLRLKSYQISEPLYNCFDIYGLLPNVEKLWQQKSVELLDEPDAEVSLPNELRDIVAFWRNELVYLFRPHVQADKVLFKKLPAGNLRPIISLSQGHLVIDVALLGIDNVHDLLRKDGSLECQPQPGTATGCNCSRELLLQLTLDALGSRPGLHKEKLHRQIFKRYMSVTAGKLQNLPPAGLSPVPSAAASPSPSRPASAHAGQDEHTMPPHDLLGGSQGSQSATSTTGAVSNGSAPLPNDLHVLQEAELQRKIDGMLKGSARERLEATKAAEKDGCRTVFPQPDQESREIRTLAKSAVQLDRNGQHPAARLFLPMDAQGIQQVFQSLLPVSQIQDLFVLLLELHKIFSSRRQLDQQPPFQVYWEPGTDVIAFNVNGELWYNAAKDRALQNIAARSKFWYLVICHELAHNFVHAHNSNFSQHMSEIVLTYSQRFMAVCDSWSSNSVAFACTAWASMASHCPVAEPHQQHWQ